MITPLSPGRTDGRQPKIRTRQIRHRVHDENRPLDAGRNPIPAARSLQEYMDREAADTAIAPALPDR